MLANFSIGLREGLEACLVVSILIAYLVKSHRRHLLPMIWAGVAVAVAVSLAFGAALTFGPRGLTFEAQELIGGALSIIAVGFVTWMIFWMAREARAMSGVLRDRIDEAVGNRPWSLMVVAALAVGREGLETALFLWASTQAVTRDTGASSVPLLSAGLGIGCAILLGYLIYRGAIKINLTRFFTWTGLFLIIVAAGVLAYGVHDLQEARFLPGLNTLAFDVSRLVPPTSWYGSLLKGVFNFSPATTVLEAIAWLGYAIPTLSVFIYQLHRRSTVVPPAPIPVPVTSERT